MRGESARKLMVTKESYVRFARRRCGCGVLAGTFARWGGGGGGTGVMLRGGRDASYDRIRTRYTMWDSGMKNARIARRRLSREIVLPPTTTSGELLGC